MGDRLHAALGGRHVTLIRIDSTQYSAIDSICYHAGGPLGAGNIEDIVVEGNEKISCVRCPWHHYLISLKDGEKWYNALERNDEGKLVPVGWRSSRESLQRVHQTELRDDGIYVRIDARDEIRSDKYAFRDDCAAGLGRGGRRISPAPGADGSIRSGSNNGRVPSGQIFRR